MGRGKAIKHELVAMYIEFSCSKCEKNIRFKFKDFDLNAHVQDCETCGSHGDVTADMKCVGCGKNITLELKGW